MFSVRNYRPVPTSFDATPPNASVVCAQRWWGGRRRGRRRYNYSLFSRRARLAALRMVLVRCRWVAVVSYSVASARPHSTRKRHTPHISIRVVGASIGHSFVDGINNCIIITIYLTLSLYTDGAVSLGRRNLSRRLQQGTTKKSRSTAVTHADNPCGGDAPPSEIVTIAVERRHRRCTSLPADCSPTPVTRNTTACADISCSDRRRWCVAAI